jgi:hypothetical protein
MDTVQSRKIQIDPVHDVERPGFDGRFVEDVDIVNLAGGNNDKGRNASMKVQQRVQYDRRFAPSEFCSREQGQAKIDRRGIQGVGGLHQFDAKIVVFIQVHHLSKYNSSFVHNRFPPEVFREKFHTKATCN